LQGGLLRFEGVMEVSLNLRAASPDGLQVEEFYDFVGSDRGVIWAYAHYTSRVAVKAYPTGSITIWCYNGSGIVRLEKRRE
jgi:hypothetical protein